MAGMAVVFAVFGVNEGTAIIVAFLISALITRPDVWRGWLLLVLAAVAALPFMLLASIYTFAFRAAFSATGRRTPTRIPRICPITSSHRRSSSSS